MCLYHEYPTWQGLAVKPRSSTSLPDVRSDSWVRLIYVGCGRILIHYGVSLARSARYPIRPQSDLSVLAGRGDCDIAMSFYQSG